MAGGPRLPGSRTRSVIVSRERAKRRSAAKVQPWFSKYGTVYPSAALASSLSASRWLVVSIMIRHHTGAHPAGPLYGCLPRQPGDGAGAGAEATIRAVIAAALAQHADANGRGLDALSAMRQAVGNAQVQRSDRTT